MATIDNPEIINDIIANDGWYQGDRTEKRAVKIVSYLNQWGGKSTAVVYEGEDYMRYETSPACRAVQTIWQAAAPAPSGVSDGPTPYAVRCREHGLVYLTDDEYTRQMMHADSRWVCPTCGGLATFDDDTYEAALDELAELAVDSGEDALQAAYEDKRERDRDEQRDYR